MEENKNVVEALRSEVENLKKKLGESITLVKSSQDTAEQYKSWWLKKCDEVNAIRSDMQLIDNMYKKLSEKW